MKLSIDGKKITNDWKHNPFTTEPIFLKKGVHSAFAEMFQKGGGYRFSLKIEGPGLSKQFL